MMVNIILSNTFKNWNLISIEIKYGMIWFVLIFFLYYVVKETMVGSTIDATSQNEECDPSPQASIDK